MENLTTNLDSNNNMNISSDSFMKKSNAGIKFLLNIRNFKTEELENDEFVIENKKLITEENYRNQYENIDEEYCKKHLNEMDDLIKDIKNTKDNLKMSKLKETIKTREDILNFYNIKDSNNFKYAPEPIIRDSNYLKNFNLEDTESHQKNKEFKDIQNIINSQNNNMKDIEFIKPEDIQTNSNNISIKESMFPTSIKFKNDLDNKFNNDNIDHKDYLEDKKTSKGFEFSNPIMNRNSYNLTEEERNFMNKYVYNTNDSDELMEELDDCIKLGDEIDDYIKYVEK